MRVEGVGIMALGNNGKLDLEKTYEKQLEV